MINPEISWNDGVRLVISDVDETMAPVYEPAAPEMMDEVNGLLDEGVNLLLVSGGSLRQVNSRVISQVDPSLRSGIIVGHCNGAETWGYDDAGILRDEPYYSAYDEQFSEPQKSEWRATTEQLLGEFGLRRHSVRPPRRFLQEVGTDPQDIMIEDRGPQITLEMVNAYDMTSSRVAALQGIRGIEQDGSRDLRPAIVSRANELFEQLEIPVSARLGGIFAVDLAIRGVNKAAAVRHTLGNPYVLESIGLSAADLELPDSMEIWGEKFAVSNGGTDRHMSEAVAPEVRSIDFRDEDPADFIPGHNIIVWNGERHFQDGLLEYLQARH